MRCRGAILRLHLHVHLQVHAVARALAWVHERCGRQIQKTVASALADTLRLFPMYGTWRSTKKGLCFAKSLVRGP